MDQGENIAERFQTGTTRTGAMDLLAAAIPHRNRIIATILPPRDIPGLEPSLRTLERRALVPNVFYSADFLVAASQHFRNGAPTVIAAWERIPNSSAMRLVGLLPVARPGLGLPGAVQRGWAHPFLVLGNPLLDRDCAEAAWDAILTALADLNPDVSGLLLKDVDLSGALGQILSSVAADRSAPIMPLSTAARAMTSGAPMRSETGGRNGKELRRQRRRLSELGTLRFSVSERADDLRRAAETFLALEAAGWKGAAGSALIRNPDSANFTRALLRSGARQDGNRIAELTLDGKTIASVIILVSGSRGALWKIAYDESFAKFSPGALLIEDVTRWMRNAPQLMMLDSCATEGHGLIESLWDERLVLTDLMIGLRRQETTGFAACVARERLRRSLRQHMRSAWHWLRAKL
ncbi:MAG: GNAT family N-acetyltransferase [Proteobacteria bacterium]|nr:GNAT family N-acetyltransferase [Pseudomonadota bacterium]